MDHLLRRKLVPADVPAVWRKARSLQKYAFENFWEHLLGCLYEAGGIFLQLQCGWFGMWMFLIRAKRLTGSEILFFNRFVERQWRLWTVHSWWYDKTCRLRRTKCWGCHLSRPGLDTSELKNPGNFSVNDWYLLEARWGTVRCCWGMRRSFHEIVIEMSIASKTASCAISLAYCCCTLCSY